MRARIAFLSALLWLVTVTLAQAQSLPSVKPEQVGLSSERLGRLTATLRADAEKGTIPGAVLLVARHGKVALFDSVGVLNPETKAPMPRDGIFRIYSMTKPIASVLVMTLVEDGRIALSDAKIWEDYPSNAEFVDRLAKVPLANQRGYYRPLLKNMVYAALTRPR